MTGSPMAEVLHQNLAEIEASDIHERLGLEKGRYILLSAHREENIDTEKNFLSLFTAINMMAEKYDIYYRVHSADFGWLGWTKNGKNAGSEGYGKRIEAIQIQLVEKGNTFSGNTKNSFYVK